MKKLLPLLFLACCSIATAQDTIRVCTYNVLNYSQSNEDGREDKFRSILQEIRPGILIAQEIGDAFGTARLASAYAAVFSTISHVPFHDGNDSDNGLFWRNRISKFDEIYHTTSLRDIAEYQVKVKQTEDTLYIFSVHLKAGDTKEDEEQRLSEINILKNALPKNPDAKVLIAGDFNFYSSNEPGYKSLLQGDAFKIIDPLGFWVRNSTAYIDYYTQSPRVSPDAACGGGTGGGMDDRFDFIFYSESLAKNYIKGSYTVFGNDGEDRLNSDINDPPNKAVSSFVAANLRCASDHLPVYADFVFGGPTSVHFPGFVHEITFTESPEHINVFLPSSGQVTVTNILGYPIQVIQDDGGNQHLSKAGLLPGVYFIQATAKADTGSVFGHYKFVVAE